MVPWSETASPYLYYGVVVTGVVFAFLFVGCMVARISGRRSLTDKSALYHEGLRNGKSRARAEQELSTNRPGKAGGYVRDAMRHQARFDNLLRGQYQGQEIAGVAAYQKGQHHGYHRVKS